MSCNCWPGSAFSNGKPSASTFCIASDTEIEELRHLAKELQNRVLDWLRTHHAPLLKEPLRVHKGPRPRKRDRH